MKKHLLSLLTIFILGCSSSDDSTEEDIDYTSGSACYYNDHLLHRGPQGGCYYLSSGGSKEYVDRSYCNCN